MDKEMMRALQKDAEMLEAMGAGEQPLFFLDGSGFVLCESCLEEPADHPSKFCVGCFSYRDHQA